MPVRFAFSILALFALLVLAGSAAPRAEAGAFAADEIPGNVNCSEPPAEAPLGATNSVDAALILQLAADIVPSLPCQDTGDVNVDGSLDPVDAALILQIEARLLRLVYVSGPLEAGVEAGCYLIDVGAERWLLLGDLTGLTAGQTVEAFGLIGADSVSICNEGDVIVQVISIQKVP